MRRGRRRHTERMLTVDITPMVDVVFLLIIFFLSTARFAADTRAELDLPRERGEQQETNQEAGLIVNIDATGAVIVGRRTMTLDELETLVRDEIDRARGRDPTAVRLLLRADRRADTRRLNDVIERLQHLGVGAARLATEVP